MKNNKGFTLIELIMVTIILGILAAVAVPRYMGAVSNAEAAAEAATVAALRSAVENYATQKFLETGRYSYPPNPFNYIEVDGYEGVKDAATNDGGWAISAATGEATITHKRRDDNVYSWTYNSSDLTDLDGDDRGANVGLAPENPNTAASSYVVVKGTRVTSSGDVDSGGSGI
jgi:general secretion pathway protein G